jgi:hypothetical protein
MTNNEHNKFDTTRDVELLAAKKKISDDSPYTCQASLFPAGVFLHPNTPQTPSTTAKWRAAMSLYHITIINRETKRKKGISEDSLGKRHTSLPTHGPVGRGTITTAFSGK